jgi:hypothetical protein
MIEKLQQSSGQILAFKISGKLHDEDYRQFVPVVEEAIQAHGKVRLLAEFADFHGWDLHAVWDDTKFATKHCGDVEKVAIIGDKQWERWMATICKPFTRAKVQYFDVSQTSEAWKWIQETVG